MLQHHKTANPEDNEGKTSFMKAKYCDSIAKAEQNERSQKIKEVNKPLREENKN